MIVLLVFQLKKQGGSRNRPYVIQPYYIQIFRLAFPRAYLPSLLTAWLLAPHCAAPRLFAFFKISGDALMNNPATSIVT